MVSGLRLNAASPSSDARIGGRRWKRMSLLPETRALTYVNSVFTEEWLTFALTKWSRATAEIDPPRKIARFAKQGALGAMNLRIQGNNKIIAAFEART